MSKFHLNKVIREANKAKKEKINRIKHDIVYGGMIKVDIDYKLTFLDQIDSPFRRQYEWIESQRRQGLRIA